MRTPSRRWAVSAACIGLLVPATGAAATPATAPATSDVVVVLDPDASERRAAQDAERAGADVEHVFGAALNGFSASVDADELADLAADPDVLVVEPDLPVAASRTQASPPWGLDRIDQQRVPLDERYATVADGAGVTAYVVDSGVARHVDLGPRLRTGYGSAGDCEGHGTHVAGTLGGASFGVAGAVSLVSVRVLDCQGEGTVEGVLRGLDWVLRDHRDGVPAVANISLGGPASAALDAAVQALVDDGVVVVVAAGNEGADACGSSPARLPAAITVGATATDDSRARYSNTGRCLDLFAPGSWITSASNTDLRGAAVKSGTSMAAPHVAGAAALLLSRAPDATPAQVSAALTQTGVPGVPGRGTGSPDRLLHLPHVTGAKPAAGSGYWMLPRGGAVAAFGAAPFCGAATPGGSDAVDVEPLPDGSGYWVLGASGDVRLLRCPGAAATRVAGSAARPPALVAGESAVSMSATPDGRGYWVFTDRGRVVATGTARHLGDMTGVRLNGPVLDSVATPTGNGYFMVASDGGIFTFGDARFAGSTGDLRLNQPVVSMAPDTDGRGYWLVASDGGIFAFDARFHGSTGALRLNRPVSGMVASPTGRGYLLVAEDGGVFTFGDVPFHGSLGSSPPRTAVGAIAAMP